MISLSVVDIIIIVSFFFLTTALGVIFSGREKKSKNEFLLSGGKVGLILFVMTNVSTWYGGILGVGEYSFRYGLASWFTQGLPYYIFAGIFAFLMTGKIKSKTFYSIPEAINETYGVGASRMASLLIFILVTPAPYLLMVAYLLKVVFQLPLIYGLLFSFVLSALYLFKGGYKSDLITDAVFFVIMFLGFAIFLIILYLKYGGVSFLYGKLPEAHLTLSGGLPLPVIIVWWLVSLWTFADPGFYQRTTAAKNVKVARDGILISILFWFLFDFLTNVVGLFSKALLTELKEPVLAFPLLAEKELGSGMKALFLIALFSTILSTLNSFLFLSGLTFGNDILSDGNRSGNETQTVNRVKAGILLSGFFSIILAISIPSVIEIWYTVGSICIPGIIFLIFSSYFPRFKVRKFYSYIELIGAPAVSLLWYLGRETMLNSSFLVIIEPMLAGMGFSLLVHIAGLARKKRLSMQKKRLSSDTAQP